MPEAPSTYTLSHEATDARTRILMAAIEVFNRQGYQASSMAVLGQACGLAKGSFYHHFPTKEALLDACLSFAGQYITERVFSEAYRTDAPAPERAEAMMRRLVRISSHQHQGCFFGNLASETAHLDTAFRQRLQGYFDRWAKALASLLTEQGLSPAQAATQAQTIIWLYEGAALSSKLSRSDQPLQDAKAMIVAMLSPAT